MEQPTRTSLNRRSFLRTTAAASAALALTDSQQIAANAQAQSVATDPAAIQLLSAKNFAEQWQSLEAAPANKTIVDSGTFTIMLTVERSRSAPEFEWHEGRDHIVQIVEGSTVYLVGGTPKNARSVKPGEWLAPVSEGAVAFKLDKGDMLLIPRGTPHKRSTEGSVRLMLISPTGKSIA